MKISKLLYFAVAISLLAVFVVPNVVLAEPPASTRMLENARKLAVEAQQTEGKLTQGKKFQDAIEAYNKVISKDRESANTAIAMLEMAQIYAGVPVGQVPPARGELKSVYSSTVKGTFKESKLQNDYTARDQFGQLLSKFDSGRKYQDLVDKYGSEEATKIKAVVDQTVNYKKLIEAKIDKQNSQGILYKIMDGLVRLTGKKSYSYWIAIILLTLIVKVIITPLTKAQFKSMREMQRIQPLVKELQAKYKGEQKVLGEKMMALYKEHGVNPLAGCLPLLIQMPILITLYYIIRAYEIQFANGTFLWIGWPALVHKFHFLLPLSNRIVWFTAANLAQPDLILLVLYTISMVISQRMSAVDPAQADQMKMMSIMMPIMFFFLIGYLPSAFMLYWFVFNILQTWQQYHVIHGAPALAPVTPTPEQPAPETERVRPSQRRRRRR
jgi:YidC/Oxa1 family membrane protein insertase